MKSELLTVPVTRNATKEVDVRNFSIEQLMEMQDRLKEIIIDRVYDHESLLNKHDYYMIKHETIDTLNDGLRRLRWLMHGDEYWDNGCTYKEDFAMISGWMIDRMTHEELVERGLEQA